MVLVHEKLVIIYGLGMLQPDGTTTALVLDDATDVVGEDEVPLDVVFTLVVDGEVVVGDVVEEDVLAVEVEDVELILRLELEEDEVAVLGLEVDVEDAPDVELDLMDFALVVDVVLVFEVEVVPETDVVVPLLAIQPRS